MDSGANISILHRRGLNLLPNLKFCRNHVPSSVKTADGIAVCFSADFIAPVFKGC